MNVRAGEKNRRVTVQGATQTPDGMGGYTETITTIDTVWMKVEPLQGDEQIQAMQTGMTAPHRFTATYRSDITGATTLLYDGRTFDVKSVVDPDEKHRDLVLMTDEVT